ncbi:MAG: flagellar basal body protein [Pseudomonadota bacterium]
MLENIKMLTIASALQRHSAERHSVIAENIANADTRNYKAKDIEPFDQAFARLSRAGVENNAGGAAMQSEWRTFEAAQLGSHSPNGNTVSLEEQMMQSIEAQQSHEAATTIYRKAIDILRMSLGRNA